MTETTVFQSGNSQAVRLPKEFRFTSKTVEIFRRGDEIVLREKRPQTLAELVASWPPLDAEGHAEFDAMLAAINEPQQERDWAELFGEKPRAARKAAAGAKTGKPPARR